LIMTTIKAEVAPRYNCFLLSWIALIDRNKVRLFSKNDTSP
jgi:hypothetical protein